VTILKRTSLILFALLLIGCSAAPEKATTDYVYVYGKAYAEGDFADGVTVEVLNADGFKVGSSTTNTSGSWGVSVKYGNGRYRAYAKNQEGHPQTSANLTQDANVPNFIYNADGGYAEFNLCDAPTCGGIDFNFGDSPTPTPTASEPTPVDTPTTTRTRPPTPVKTDSPGTVRTVVPITYFMFNEGKDFNTTHPEYGPVGSYYDIYWRDVNPSPGQYNWGVIDNYLASDADLVVELPDGTVLPKPILLAVFTSISSAPNWNWTYYDCTPQFVYEAMVAAGEDVGYLSGMYVGHVIEGFGTKACVPAYDSDIWRSYHEEFIRALGERYADNERITAVIASTGLDGETHAVKGGWLDLMNQQIGGLEYRFGQFMLDTMDDYRAAFPHTAVFINNAPGGSGTRKITADYAAQIDPPLGMKHSGMWVHNENGKGYGSYVGSWDMYEIYRDELTLWGESPYGLGSLINPERDPEYRYWTYLRGLHAGIDAASFHPEFYYQSCPEWLTFFVERLNVNAVTAPSAWTALRDMEKPIIMWGSDGISDWPGDWRQYLTRLDAAERVWRDELPVDDNSVYGRQSRKIFMSGFDIDDTWIQFHREDRYAIEVILLDYGTCDVVLSYTKPSGGTATYRVPLEDTGKWVSRTFFVDNPSFHNDQFGADFTIASQGGVFVHKIDVVPVTEEAPTPVVSRTATPTRTRTSTPTTTYTPTPTKTATQTVIPAPTAREMLCEMIEIEQPNGEILITLRCRPK